MNDPLWKVVVLFILTCPAALDGKKKFVKAVLFIQDFCFYIL